MHKYNATLVAECMTVAVYYYIQTPFANGYRIRMTHFEGTWEGFKYIESMHALPDINSAMTFLTKISFIAGSNECSGEVVKFASCKPSLRVISNI